jgi:hypothetical protein
MNRLGHKWFTLAPKQRWFLPRHGHIPLYGRIINITGPNPKQLRLCINRPYLVKLIVILALPKLSFFFRSLRFY